MTTENYNARQCIVDGCDGDHAALGYCAKHYMQHKRGGIKIAATVCAHCGAPFRPFSVTSMYCSKKCKRAAWVLVNQDKIAGYRAHKVMREPTHSAIYAGHCDGCRKPFVSRRKRAYCSESCQPKSVHVSIMASTQACRCCGIAYKPVSTGGMPKQYCSESCANRVRAASKRINRAKRKAIIKGATVERVDPLKVFDRDKWLCQLCGIKTPKTKRGTYDDNAPELDHIQPLAKGGEHSYLNTQCACRKCNGLKSDTPMGQMLMFG